MIVYFSHDQIWKNLFIVASQPMFLGVMEGVQGCGRAKSANLALGTGLEQDETRNWECQNNNEIIFQSLFSWLTD